MKFETRSFVVSKVEYRVEKDTVSLNGIFPYGRLGHNGIENEIFLPYAFNRSLEQRANVMLLIEHELEKCVANTKDGSLKVNETRDGISFNAAISDDVKQSFELRNGNELGISVGFLSNSEYIHKKVRVIRHADLVELSLVNDPAYPDATAKVPKWL